MLGKSQSPEVISDLTGEPLASVYKVQEHYMQLVKENASYDGK